MAAEEERTVVLRSLDGVEMAVSEAEAMQSWYIKIGMGYHDPSRPIRVFVQGNILSKAMEYCKKHAGAGADDEDLRDWDTGFIHALDHDALFNLVLTKGKSAREMCDIFDMRIPGISSSSGSGSSSPKPILEKALQALDIARRQEFMEYDPKLNADMCTRVSSFNNLAFFDVHNESTFSRGPSLHELIMPSTTLVFSCINVISLKVAQSDVGFPVYGAVWLPP
ncbi:uncharacterized protein LOC112270776 [Brachypodium distachyon]|uniref:uncharacterized protein LOC112270776 n=1 Tax=Brachypodium distachyon TaxID=15368 RepID=UPI00052FF108|nr:uncharacterized protein LOC112270776 [Brachypodium distachyon]|eukprot:XP_024314658.1 uncharacterized protein LOC112270776 [Brachypodium distachyon]